MGTDLLLLALLLALAAPPLFARWRRSRAAEGGEGGTADGLPAGRVARRAHAAGLGSGGGLLTLLVAGGIVATFAAVWLGAGPLLAGAATAGGLWAVWAAAGGWMRHRALRLERRLADTLPIMVAALRAGQNPRQALATAAEAAGPPLGGELAAVVERLDLGVDLARALDPMTAAWDSEGLRLFRETLIAKWRTGGDLAPVLHTLARVLRERLRQRSRARSELAGVRGSAALVALLPWLLAAFLYWQQPAWIGRLLSTPPGPALLAGAVLLQIVGLLWVHRVLRVETA